MILESSGYLARGVLCTEPEGSTKGADNNVEDRPQSMAASSVTILPNGKGMF
jgi:hypothetical protein